MDKRFTSHYAKVLNMLLTTVTFIISSRGCKKGDWAFIMKMKTAIYQHLSANFKLLEMLIQCTETLIQWICKFKRKKINSFQTWAFMESQNTVSFLSINPFPQRPTWDFVNYFTLSMLIVDGQHILKIPHFFSIFYFSFSWTYKIIIWIDILILFF